MILKKLAASTAMVRGLDNNSSKYEKDMHTHGHSDITVSCYMLFNYIMSYFR